MTLTWKITWEEDELLKKHFKSIKRPKYKFKYFFNNPDKVTRHRKSNYYWKEDYKPPRIKFIEKIIKSLE